MPDWTIYDPQLQQLHAEGVTSAEMARRLALKPQTVRDRLIKLGLLITKPKTKPSATQEKPMPEEVVPTLVDIAPVTNGGNRSLSPAERQTLEHYEQIIAQGLQTFIEVGHALLAIRDQRLYRQSYETFESYLSSRWDMSRPRAYQLIDAAKVIDAVSTTVDILPTNEAQTRHLAPLPREQQVEAWQEAVATAPPSGVTAKHVQAVVKRIRATTGASRRQQEKPAPDRARKAAEWRDRFSRHFREFEQLLDRFKQAGGVLVLVRDWETVEQRRFLGDLRQQARTLTDMIAHFEKVIVGEEAALNALPEESNSQGGE